MDGVELVAKERKRQIEKEGWTAEHDDEHDRGELASMAVCYASPFEPFVLDERQGYYCFIDAFPTTWDRKWDKRKYFNAGFGKLEENQDLPVKERIRNLVKAGALICAEIDRLQRLK